jgi:hypothetical protein
MFENNPFISRRIGNIFGGPGQDPESPFIQAGRKFKFDSPPVQPVNSKGPTSEEASNDPLSLAMKRLQGGQASSAYREHIGMMPKQEDYAPSRGRRLGGALAAAAAAYKNPQAGAAIGEQIVGAPYRNAVESWQMKGAGLKEQADIESQDVKSQIEYIKRIQEQQQKQREYDLNVRKVDIDEEQANTNRQYRQAQIEDMKDNGWKEDHDPQGNLILYHPDGRMRNMGPTIAGRQQADRERGTDATVYNAQTSRGQLGVAQGNLGMRGQEFNYKMGQDAITNRQADQRIGISQQTADQAGMNAGSAGYVNAGENFTANAMAAQEVARTDPRFAGWSLDEQGMPRKPGNWWGTNAVDPTEAKDYLAAIETARQNILKTRRPGVGAVPGRVQPPNLGGMGQGPIKFGDLQPGGAPPPDPYRANRF